MAAPVDVYPYRLTKGTPEFLVLKRAADKKYSGQWRMVGGKKEGCETAWQSGLRELREETGIFPIKYWAVPSLNHFYDPEDDVIHHIPVFAAEVDGGHAITLDEEHTDFKWIDHAKVDAHIHWPEQQRLMALIRSILTDKTILNEWEIPL